MGNLVEACCFRLQGLSSEGHELINLLSPRVENFKGGVNEPLCFLAYFSFQFTYLFNKVSDCEQLIWFLSS